MENWQFLIQKQGDRTWRTLESPHLKILAGKYRVLARSYLSNIDIEVRVIHTSTLETPPKRRILKRSRRTNAEGLMAVIPFTYFKPGIWELRCSGDVMSDMLGKSWQHTLNIQVLPQETGIESQPQLANESDLEADTGVSLVMSHSTPVWFKGETTEQILQNLLDLALPQDESLLEEETIENAPTLPPPLSLNLTLDQDTYVANWGENFIIHGYVEVNEIENLEDERFATGGICQLRLEIALRSPLESRILNRLQQSLTNQSLPFNFSSLIDIPSKCESKLILADINLYGALADVSKVILLASHTFTITANVTELLAQQTSPSDPLDFPPENNLSNKPKPSANVGLELFNLAKTPNLAQFHIFKPSANQPLPPRIKPLVDGEGFSPELPTLPHNPTSEITTEEKAQIIPPIDLKKLVIKPINSTFPYLRRLRVKSPKEEIVNNQLIIGDLETSEKSSQLPTAVPSIEKDDSQEINKSVMDETEISYAELIAEIVGEDVKSEELDVVEVEESALVFKSEELELDVADTQNHSPLLQQWMQSQGGSLTEANSEASPDPDDEEETESVDIEQLLNLDGEIATPENQTFEEIPLEINEPEIVNLLNPIATQPVWLSEEIVIDDIPVEVDSESLGSEVRENHNDSLPLEDQVAVDSSPVIIDSLPTPQLFVPEGELVAGTSVTVRVELPKVSSSVAVKLWVEDYQTRSLLDGPHILPDLRSNAWGGGETAISLKIPFGCLEIRLAAIALNQTTQQESNKVTIIRTVIPPDLPTIQLDELLGI
ncbi:hypothetical protein [Anabaena sp. UHCC 0204]|uniref:hypothetical protein n=1 Tax=Anabaena sp. UHCC 0204 TaxID=2590009 RepID=UPI001444FE0D|nr:hypothetical protein [Anabaena sp. UHCC 0204]MTJ09797.1 hypothetical protein [Anabaena sp. UHCC 0204]